MSEERRTGWEEADRWFAAGPPGGGGPGGGQGEGEGPPPVPRCEVCGSELEPDQTYCLECGSPTPLAPRLSRGGRTAAMLAAALVVLGLGAGALAYAVASDDGDGGGATTAGATIPPPVTTPGAPLPPTTGALPPDTSVLPPTATAPTAPTAPAPTGFDTVTGPTETAPTEAPEPPVPPEPAPPEPDTGSGDWPAGRTAWTAILSSVRSESDARAAKARLQRAGEPAGVLFSSDVGGLRPGYWVVFSGTYDDRAQAVAQADALRPQWPGAYARRIEG